MKKCLILLSFLLPVMLFAQSKTGTTIGQFLKIEPSARAATFGGAGASLSGEASLLFYNAASIGRLKNVDAQFTYNEWIADISYNYGVVAVPVQSIGTFALQLTSLNSGEMDVRTVEAPMGTGERFTVTNFALGLGFGTMLTDRVSAGVLINYVQESIWHSSLSTYSINFGVQYQTSPKGLTLGASVANFGPRAKYDGRDLYIDHDFDPKKYGDNDLLPSELRTDEFSLPTSFRVGISFPVEIIPENIITFAVDALHPNDNKESVNLGAEYAFMNNFFVRAGLRDLFLEDREGGLMLGAGFKVALSDNYNIRFDYAWADYGRLEHAHRFTFGVGF